MTFGGPRFSLSFTSSPQQPNLLLFSPVVCFSVNCCLRSAEDTEEIFDVFVLLILKHSEWEGIKLSENKLG